MKFAVTFGQKYRNEPHPVLRYVDVDGFLLVYAKDKEVVHDRLFELYGAAWSFVYPYNTDEERATVDKWQYNGEFLRMNLD